MVVGSYTIQILYKVWNQQRTSYSLSFFLPFFFPFSLLFLYLAILCFFSLSLYFIYPFFFLFYILIIDMRNNYRTYQSIDMNSRVKTQKRKSNYVQITKFLSCLPYNIISRTYDADYCLYSYYRRCYKTSDPKKREKKRKRLVRKFMRDRRELLLLNKTLKYLITVPVISVEGNGIGAMFSSFVA